MSFSLRDKSKTKELRYQMQDIRIGGGKESKGESKITTMLFPTRLVFRVKGKSQGGLLREY